MFENRREAGIKLASLLLLKRDLENSIIVSLPRGGVIVGAVISEILKIPHTALIVKKIGAPSNPELAVGAVASGGIVYWDNEILKYARVDKNEKKEQLDKALEVVEEREKSLDIAMDKPINKPVIVVDDGVATGATAIAAALALKKCGAKKIILATPVISKTTKSSLKSYFDDIITVELPQDFRALSEFYRGFPQVEDKEVVKLLKNTK